MTFTFWVVLKNGADRPYVSSAMTPEFYQSMKEQGAQVHRVDVELPAVLEDGVVKTRALDGDRIHEALAIVHHNDRGKVPRNISVKRAVHVLELTEAEAEVLCRATNVDPSEL